MFRSLVEKLVDRSRGVSLGSLRRFFVAGAGADQALMRTGLSLWRLAVTNQQQQPGRPRFLWQVASLVPAGMDLSQRGRMAAAQTRLAASWRPATYAHSR